MSRRFILHLMLTSLILCAGIWLSSGTMAPYAATWNRPIVSQPCAYLYNIDHDQFRASFLMLDGAPRRTWAFSVVLRRILFPLVAYPAMKLLGFEVGGFLTSLVLQVAAFVSFILFLQRRLRPKDQPAGDDTAVKLTMWLLATYPGIAYWAALPYSYVSIVPSCLWLLMLLIRLDEDPRASRVPLWTTLMGVLFIAYDLMPVFLPATLLLLLWQRRYAHLPIAAVCLCAPQMLAIAALQWRYHMVVFNSNTDVYLTVLRAYVQPKGPRDLAAWAALLRELPGLLWVNYLFSNFLFLPLLFLALLGVAGGALVAGLIRRRRSPSGTPGRTAGVRLTPPGAPEVAILLSVGLIFLFNNAAPPYAGRWQMRGEWIPRLYQPAFVALLFYAARACAFWSGRARVLARLLTILAILGNASIVFGPALGGPLGRSSGWVYHRFYMHAPPDTMTRNLRVYGRRPLGFCKR